MLGRRFIVLVAVLMGLTALAASVAPRQPIERGGQATPTPTPSSAPAGEASVTTVQERITTTGRPMRVTVEEGTLLELEVSGPELDSISLLDEVVVIAPEAAARFDVLADTPGSYPIELVDAGRRVGTLVVREARG